LLIKFSKHLVKGKNRGVAQFFARQWNELYTVGCLWTCDWQTGFIFAFLVYVRSKFLQICQSFLRFRHFASVSMKEESNWMNSKELLVNALPQTNSNSIWISERKKMKKKQIVRQREWEMPVTVWSNKGDPVETRWRKNDIFKEIFAVSIFVSNINYISTSVSLHCAPSYAITNIRKSWDFVGF
jgi:hypothetical protein